MEEGNERPMSWTDFYQQLKTKNQKFLQPKSLKWLLQNASENKHIQLKADATLEFMKAKLDESMKTMSANDSYDVKFQNAKTLIRLSNLKKEKEDMVKRSVKTKEEYERVMARQAQEYCIERQINHQKMIESTDPDQDPVKEELIQELKSCHEVLGSLEQELTAKIRSCRRLKEEETRLNNDVNSLTKQLKTLENDLQVEHVTSSTLLPLSSAEGKLDSTLEGSVKIEGIELLQSCSTDENSSFIEAMEIGDDDENDDEDDDFIDVADDE